MALKEVQVKLLEELLAYLGKEPKEVETHVLTSCRAHPASRGKDHCFLRGGGFGIGLPRDARLDGSTRDPSGQL